MSTLLQAYNYGHVFLRPAFLFRQTDYYCYYMAHLKQGTQNQKHNSRQTARSAAKSNQQNILKDFKL